MYRRVIGTEMWHSSPQCSFWPAVNYVEEENPTIGQRCARCRELEMLNQHRRADDPEEQ